MITSWRSPISQFLNPFPKYLQIRQLLLRRLQQEFQPGDVFPSDQALVQEFGVSRETVREAVRGLAAEGWITRHRGQGTFVCEAPRSKSDHRVTGLAESMADLNADTKNEILQRGITRVSHEIAHLLNMKSDSFMYRLVRLRYFEGEPLSHSDAYLPIDIGEQLSSVNLERSSVMNELRKTFSIRFHERQQTIDAVSADAEIARLLKVPVAAPLLLLTRWLVLESDGRSILFRSHYRSDRYYYTVQLADRQKDRRTSKTKTRRSP